MFLDGRFGKTYEDDDAIAARVAPLWEEVNIEVWLPVVYGPDVASLVYDTIGLAHQWAETRRSAGAIERVAVLKQHLASG